ncbi:hypothetical protein GCM10025734_55040 [Kitasatospora paranensis]
MHGDTRDQSTSLAEQPGTASNASNAEPPLPAPRAARATPARRTAATGDAPAAKRTTARKTTAKKTTARKSTSRKSTESDTVIGRIPVLDVSPLVDSGRRPAKAVEGESFPVTATVFREGHDAVNANVVLRDPRGRSGPWTPMRELEPGSDRWGRRSPPPRPDAGRTWWRRGATRSPPGAGRPR